MKRSTLLFPEIPASRTDAVELALFETFGKTEAEELSLLSGGLSGSAVFKIVMNGSPYLLKLSEPQETLAAPPPQYYQLVAVAGIAPPLHYFDAACGVSISAFIENLSIFSLPPEKRIHELAATIKAIHQVKVEGAATDLLQLTDGVVQWLQQSGLFTPQTWEEFTPYYESIRNLYPWHDSAKVLSHNDVNPGNTLWDGKKIWMIDWDVASVNDRYVDLAVAANFFIYQEAGEKQLLDLYFSGAAGAVETARFQLMRQVCRVVFAKEMLQRAVQAAPAGFWSQAVIDESSLSEVSNQLRAGKLSLQTKEGQFLYGKALFYEALQQMRSPQFADYLACVA